jgi:hypothetical protein
VAYNFQTGNNTIKLLTEYESVIKKVLFGNSVLAALMSGRKWRLFKRNQCAYCGFSKQSPLSKRNVVNRTQYGKAPPADNAIQRWLKQFQETGSVLHRKGAGRPGTSQEDVARIQKSFFQTHRNQHTEAV